MLIEVGKTYINRAGSICRVVSYDRSFDSYYCYFPLEDGKENREKSFQVDGYGSNLMQDDSKDLISEYKMPDLQWVWCQPDKIGLWAFGGKHIEERPSIVSVSTFIFMPPTYDAWRCYLGPIPQISQPKKLVKQTLWMVKRYANLLWEELWLPDEEMPKFASFHDIGHKTTTTREV